MNTETPINELRESTSVEDAEQLLKSNGGWRVMNIRTVSQQTNETRGNGKMELPRIIVGRNNPDRN